MRVTFLMTTGIDRPAGRRYLPIAREMVRRGHHVRILALHPDLANCVQRRFVREGVEIWYVGQMHARKRGSDAEHFGPLTLLRVLISSTLGMIWGIICSPADVYHLGKPQPVNGLAALIGVVLLRGQRFYVDCDDDEVLSNRLTAPWQRAVFAFWQWLLPLLALGVTVNTTFLAQRMQGRGVRRISYVPNGIDLVAFRRPLTAVLNGLRASLGLEGTRIIGYAGTISLQNHPVDLLIDAFAHVASDMPNMVLLLIGGGEDMAAIRQQVEYYGLQDRVYFTGQVSHAAVRHFLALADISADPVRDDVVARARSPLKLFESIALGVPMLTGAVGDRPALLAEAGGFLAAPGDAAALAQTLRAALDNPAWLQAASAAALRSAPQYDWALLAKRWMAVYSER